MQLHQIKPIHKKKDKKRIGRGGKKGTYSGRGIKGQKSRAGGKMEPAIRGLIKKYPKLRGYRFKPKESKRVVINIGDLNFKDKEVVTPEFLIEKRLIRKLKGKVPQVKILAKGEIKAALIFEGCEVSKTAKEKIEKAGGQVK